MVVPEAAFAGLTEVVSKFFHRKDLTGFLVNLFATVLPNHFKHIPNSSYDVIWMLWVIDKNAVFGDP